MGYELGGNDFCGEVCCAKLSASGRCQAACGLQLILSMHNISSNGWVSLI